MGCSVCQCPIYETSSPDQVEWVVQDSSAVAIVCGNKNLEAVFAAKAGLLGACHDVFTMDTGGIDDLMRAGADISDELIMEQPAPRATAWVMAVDSMGRIVHDLQAEHPRLSMVTTALEEAGSLYLGCLTRNVVGVIQNIHASS